MKFKLDENLGRAAAAVLLEAGFDVLTISDQQMEGALDRDAIECCVREERCLVTLDAEFGNPLLYPPRRYRGNCSPARSRARDGGIDPRYCQNAARRSPDAPPTAGASFPCPVLTGACGSCNRGGYGCIRVTKRTTDDAPRKEKQDPNVPK